MSKISFFLIAACLSVACMVGWLTASTTDARGGKYEEHTIRPGGSVHSLPVVY